MSSTEHSSFDNLMDSSIGVNSLLDSYEAISVKLTNSNFDTWAIETKNRIQEFGATHLLFSEPLIDQDLDKKVVTFLLNSIEEDVKKEMGTGMLDCSLYKLWEYLEKKFVPQVDCHEVFSVNFLRSVYFKPNQNIFDYNNQFVQKVNMVNRNKNLISDELAILMLIDSYSKTPKIRSQLLDYLENLKRENRFVSLKHIVNHANLHCSTPIIHNQINEVKDDESKDDKFSGNTSDNTTEYSSNDDYYRNFKSRFVKYPKYNRPYRNHNPYDRFNRNWRFY